MTRFSVPDISCGHCKAAVEKALQALDADAEVNVDLAAKHVEVASAKADAEVIAALESAGFPASVTP